MTILKCESTVPRDVIMIVYKTPKGVALTERYGLNKRDGRHSNNHAYKDQITQRMVYSEEAQSAMRLYSRASLGHRERFLWRNYVLIKTLGMGLGLIRWRKEDNFRWRIQCCSIF